MLLSCAQKLQRIKNAQPSCYFDRISFKNRVLQMLKNAWESDYRLTVKKPWWPKALSEKLLPALPTTCFQAMPSADRYKTQALCYYRERLELRTLTQPAVVVFQGRNRPGQLSNGCSLNLESQYLTVQLLAMSASENGTLLFRLHIWSISNP